MTDDRMADLERRMGDAMDAEDYETAADLRDQIRALRGEAPVPGSRLRRQEPGRMGLGTDQQAMAPPTGWKPPPRPDPMTAGHKPRKGRR
ncbi:MAG: UvrB/UvrC motif-containing protein [Caulobacteraceae bacterium]